MTVRRFNLLVFSTAIMVLSSSWAQAETSKLSNRSSTFQYEFNWGFVSVASLEIDFTAQDSEGIVESFGKTTGLSKIFKNYSARVLVQKIDEGGRLYELLGLDRGVEEIRKIRFRRGELPQVLNFKDSSSENSLTARRNYDEDSLDPLSVLAWLFSEGPYSKGCNNRFRVFDGKKRFTVKIEPILTKQKPIHGKSVSKMPEVTEASSELISCRITMIPPPLGDNALQGEGQNVSFWPFNRKEQVMEVILGTTGVGMSYVYKFVIYSPIGKIVGQIRG